MERTSNSGFKPPNKERRTKALGDMTHECQATKKALANIENHWEPIRPPLPGDWLDSYNHGCYGYDKFVGKKITDIKDTLYIQPLVKQKNSWITDKNMNQLKQWLEAFYMPCKVVILPKIYESTLKQIPLSKLGTQRNCFGETQYNAIGILNQVIGPIQNSKSDAIGVISFTDVDLFTKSLSNFCFGYGIPSLGGVQSLRRFMPDFTDEEYDTQEELESQVLMRICKIATHEIGHMFGHGHCIFYQCLMMGTNHLEQTDRNPIYFCPVCYRKLWKCLGFDHVKRYEALSKACADFGQVFLEPQEYEMNNLSVKEWIDIRHNDLKSKMKDTDYSTGQRPKQQLKLPEIPQQRELSSQSMSTNSGSGSRGSNRSSKSVPPTKVGGFLKRSNGQIKKLPVVEGRWR